MKGLLAVVRLRSGLQTAANAIYQVIVLNFPFVRTGWPAGSDPLGPVQNSEWASLGLPFWIGMGPLASWGAQFEKCALQMGPFFFMGFFAAYLEVEKTWNLESTKIK